MRLTDLFQIDGAPLYAPKEDMEISFSDLDSADSGRLENGVMQRIVVRYAVGTWGFEYPALSAAEYQYVLGLLRGKASFRFTHPDPLTGAATTTEAYCSKHSIAWHSARDGRYRNLKFNIIEC